MRAKKSNETGIDQTQLHSHLSFMNKLNKKASSIPMQGDCVLITQKNNKTKIVCNDLETQIESFYHTDSDQEFIAVTNLKSLIKALKPTSKNCVVTFEKVEEGFLHIQSNKMKLKLRVENNADEFIVSEFEGTMQNRLNFVDVPDCKRRFTTLTDCISKDETRYNLTTVLLDSKNGCMVSTDGHTLHKMRIEKTDLESVCINGSMSRLIPAFLSLTKEKGVLSRTEKMICVAYDNLIMFSNFAENVSFPEYRQVIPDAFSCAFQVKSKDIENCIKQLSPFFGLNDNFWIEINKEKFILIGADCADVGEGEILLPNIWVSGYPRIGKNEKSFKIGLNNIYILRAIKGTETVIFKISGDNFSPIAIETGHNDLAIVMPMRV